MKKVIASVETSMVTMDHMNIGILILAAVAFLIITIIFLLNIKKLLSNISGSLKDPVTGKWSPKICTGFITSITIFIIHLVWIKAAFIKNDFSQLQPILIIDYAYLGSVFALRTVEKMQANKLGLNDKKDETTAP